VIPAKSHRNLAKSEKLAKIPRIQWNPANPLLRHHVPGQICSFPMSLGPKKIRKKKKRQPDFAEFPRVFAGIIVHGSPESLLRVFWEKKYLKVPTLREIKTLGGYIVKIETSVAELKIALNFRGVIRTFPYILLPFYMCIPTLKEYFSKPSQIFFSKFY
jgi:hypothetical protein